MFYIREHKNQKGDKQCNQKKGTKFSNKDIH